MAMYYLFLVMFFISLSLLIYFSYRPKKYYSLIFKTTTSILFISIGTISYLYSSCDFTYFILLIIGLGFSLFGDIFLALKINTNNGSLNKMFLLGLISFSITHIMYILAFTSIGSFKSYDLLFALALSSITILCLKHNKKIDFKNMFIPTCIYAFIISLMAFETLKLALFYTNGILSVFIIVGSLLFLISDIILSFILFHIKPNKFLGALNLFTYYIGQLLIASTLLFSL